MSTTTTTSRMVIKFPRRPLLLAIAAGIGLSLAATGSAQAAVCAKVDANRDNLSDQDRQAARMLLTQALEHSGLAVVVSGCDQEYTVFHVRMGNSVSITLMGPQGYRQANAHGIEDLPNWYDQMVRSLLTGQPMTAINNSVTRDNVASSQMAPNRVEADSLWYVRLGYGATFGGDTRQGPALGFGYRYELDSLAIDLSFFDFMIDSGNNNSSNNASAGVTATWIRLQGLYFLNPLANGSTYLGAGLGWGAAAAVKATSSTSSTGSTDSAYSGSGLEGQLTVGYEFLRASTIRMFAQADLTLPFYKASSAAYSSLSSTYSTDSIYLPTVTLTLGIGWGKSTTRVRVIQ
jgi:hypothetical protein